MRKALIESYTIQLRQSLGLRTPIEEDELRELYDAKNYAGMVRHIKQLLRLDLIVRVLIVKSGGLDAPAWISKPSLMPPYGTHAFQQTTVEVYFQKSFLKNGSFEEVVIAIAHELCHVVLDCIGHPLREQEEAVDLAAMVCGFRDFYITGCKTTNVEKPSILSRLQGYKTRTVTVNSGYLTHEEVVYASLHMTYR